MAGGFFFGGGGVALGQKQLMITTYNSHEQSPQFC